MSLRSFWNRLPKQMILVLVIGNLVLILSFLMILMLQ